MSHETAGLIGIFRKSKGAFAGGLMRSIARTFVLFVVGAAVLSIIENTGARSTGAPGITYWKLMLLGLGCIIAELIGVHHAVVAWHKAHKGPTFVWSAVWAVGFGFSIYNAMGSAAVTQAKLSNFQKAAMHSYSDARTGLDAARDRVKAEEKSVADLKRMTWQEMPKVAGKAIMSADAADALVKSYEGNTRMWGLTSQCTDAQGKQARKFCTEHGEAKAARADLKERAAWQTKVEAAERQLQSARDVLKDAITKAENTVTETSDLTPFVALVSYVTGAEPEKIKWVETFQTSFTTMLLVSLAGFVMALTAVQDKPRTPWFRLRERIRNALWGGPPPVAQTPAAPVAHQAIANPAPAHLQPVQTYQPPAPQTFRIEDGRDIGAFLRDLNAALIAPAGKTA